MPQIMSLPADNQEAFRQAVKAAQAKRGNYLTAAEMIQAAETMGAPDPFPIGVPFSNQVPVEPPKTKEQIGKANMREAMQRQLAEREAGIRAYESQTGNRPGQSDATREAIFSNRTQNLLSGQGQIPDKRAEYILQQRENESARNRALAAAQEYVQSQPSGLMQLEDYRDPRGAFARKMQERAFGLREQQMAGESADRADALGLRREGLDIEREKLASGERLASDADRRRMEMFEMEQRIADKRMLDAEGREEKTYQRRKGESDQQFDKRMAAEERLRKDERAANREDTAAKLLAAQDEELSKREFEARATGNYQLAEMVRQEREQLKGGGSASRSMPSGRRPSAPHPGLGAAIGGMTESESPVDWLMGVDMTAADSPQEQQQIVDAMRSVYGDAALTDLDKPPKTGLFERSNAGLHRQNKLRLKVGQPPRLPNGEVVKTIRDVIAVLPSDVPREVYQSTPWYQALRTQELGGAGTPRAPAPALLAKNRRR